MNGAMPTNRPGPWRPPGKGLPPGMGFSGGNVKGGKGPLSESMSLLEEMKLKQEKREQRKRLREEVDSLMVSSPQDIGRIARLRQELSYVEGFLAQADGNMALPTHQPQTTGPLTVAEGQDTNNLYVGSLSKEWTEELLSREFGRFGEITSIKIMYPRTDQQRLRGMNSGFVQFKTRAQAELARTKLNGKEYFGMCLRIDWGRAIQPVRNVSAVMGLGVTPSIIGKPALMPHVETPKPKPMPMITSGESAAASSSGERKSRWNLAKTLVVKVPEDQVLKKLIDKTAEFVADEGWEFEQLLLEKENGNPRFAFMSVEKDNLEEPLHVYYRWRTFSFSQGDNDRFWRTEPFQIYENGPLWQPPPCDKRVEEVPDAIQRIEMLMPSSSVSTSGKDNVIGGAGLTPEEMSSFQELVAELTLSRSSILKAMVFCVDKSMSSLTLAQKIGASITEAQSGLTTQQLVARMYLLNDVLYNSHCTKPGASQYRRQFQELLPDVMERLREVCDGISSIAACALRDRVLKLVESWTEWALFPPRFTKGLEAVMCNKSENDQSIPAVQQAQQQWQTTMDLATLERACRQRGLSIKGNRAQLVQRLCLFEAYWPPELQSAEPKLPKDLGIDGKIEAGLDGESYDCEMEETRPSLGLSVLLLPERWQEGAKLSKPKARKQMVPEPSSKKARKEPTEPSKETVKQAKSPEELRRERLRQVEAEVELYRQQLEKVREQPEVMQMKCDRKRMELLEAAAHQESFNEHKKHAPDAPVDSAGAPAPLPSGERQEAKKAPEKSEEAGKKEVKEAGLPDGKVKTAQDGKSGKEKDKSEKEVKISKDVKESKAKSKVQDKDVEKERDKEKEKDKEKDKDKDKDKNKEKDKEKEKGGREREKEKDKERETERESQKDKDKDRDKVKDKAKEKEKEKEREKDKVKAKESEKERRKRSRDRDGSSSGRRKRKASTSRPQKKR